MFEKWLQVYILLLQCVDENQKRLTLKRTEQAQTSLRSESLAGMTRKTAINGADENQNRLFVNNHPDRNSNELLILHSPTQCSQLWSLEVVLTHFWVTQHSYVSLLFPCWISGGAIVGIVIVVIVVVAVVVSVVSVLRWRKRGGSMPVVDRPDAWFVDV